MSEQRGAHAGRGTRLASPPFLLGLALASVVACTQQEQTVVLPSLEASGDMSFVCLGPDQQPREMRDCPDLDLSEADEHRATHALVTQTTRGEVGVINLSANAIVDAEPSLPGVNFLPVGARPGAIVSTPGSVATFVGVGEVGKEGIFALPSTCLGPRPDGEPPRDITSWPACRLPTVPGSMTILIDPADDGGNVRASCDGDYAPPEATVGVAATRAECPADLTLESDPPGRRKLVVALPDWGELAVIDAQWLLDREPGSYEPCELERRLALDVDLPSAPVSQQAPSDFDPALCAPPAEARPPSAEPRPAGMALADDRSRLFVADRAAPVIHVLDGKRPCSFAESPPLLPQSLVAPDRVVTTKKLAVSPLTADAQRFVYAIDDEDNGSVMIFDVSEGSTNRTPLIRERSAQFPFEPPDRISFTAPAKDVAFAFHDTALTDVPLGSSIDAVACDPDPDTPADDPGAQRRPSSDLRTGAGPGTLRGVFGFLALSSGQLAVVDVDDRDAACRRPIHPNTSSEEDFRGCAGDPSDELLVVGSPERPTVTNELSCQVVQPHRARSARFVQNSVDRGVRAPALRAFPRLTSALGRRLPTDQTEEGRDNPKLLGVDFSEDQPAQVYVGTTLFENRDVPDALVIDPARAEQNSLVLSFAEPRAYVPSEQFSAVYEGVVMAERPAARLDLDASGLVLRDSGVVFCDRGVEGVELMRRRAAELGVPEDAFDEFAVAHADYVEITSSLPDEDSTYWDTGVGARCGLADGDTPGAGFDQCKIQFGTPRAPTDLRQLRVRQATRSELRLEPRHYADSSIARDLYSCCFPEPVDYAVRASEQWVVRGDPSGFRHRIRTAADGRCEVDPCPLRAAFDSRAFEVSCDPDTCPLGEDEQPVIGLATSDDTACIVDAPDPSVWTLGGSASSCIFSNLTTRFVIYRGLTPSERGMAFSWEVQGGFGPLLVDVASIGNPTANTVPVSMTYLPQAGILGIADGATKGVTFVSVSTLGGSSFF